MSKKNFNTVFVTITLKRNGLRYKVRPVLKNSEESASDGQINLAYWLFRKFSKFCGHFLMAHPVYISLCIHNERFMRFFLRVQVSFKNLFQKISKSKMFLFSIMIILYVLLKRFIEWDVYVYIQEI